MSLSILVRDAAAQRYVRTTRSPWKSDPPGTYIETRSDGTKHFYRGGVEYKTETREGHVRNVPPPTRYEVKPDGSLVRTEYHGLNAVGNKVYESTKLADRIPDKYLLRDKKGNAIQYNVREYLVSIGKDAGLTNVQLPKVILVENEATPSLAFFPPAGDPNAKTGYVALRFKGWPENIRKSDKDSNPVLTVKITVNTRTFQIPVLAQEDAESTYWAVHLPSGRHAMTLDIGFHELSFSDLEAEKSGKEQLKDSWRGTYDYSRVAQHEKDFKQYCFAHNTSHSVRIYTFVHGPQYLTTAMQVYAPHGTVKVVNVDLSKMLERDDPGYLWWGQTGSGYKVLRKLYHDPDWDDRDCFVWHTDQASPKSKWQLRWHLRSYNAKPATWEVDKKLEIPSVASFDEWLCDNRLKLITLGEMIEPAAKGGASE